MDMGSQMVFNPLSRLSTTVLVIIFSIIFNETRTSCHIDCRFLNQPCPTNTSILSIPTSDASQAFAQVALRPHSFTLWRTRLCLSYKTVFKSVSVAYPIAKRLAVLLCCAVLYSALIIPTQLFQFTAFD